MTTVSERSPLRNLIDFLDKSRPPLFPGFIDRAFLLAVGGLLGPKDVTWPTIRSGLTDARAAGGEPPPSDWPKGRQRRYRAVHRRAGEHWGEVQARDAQTIIRLAYFVYPFTQRPIDLLPRLEPGTLLPDYLWTYGLARRGFRKDISQAILEPLIKASAEPGTYRALLIAPALPTKEHQRHWRDFTKWLEVRYGIGGHP